MSKSVADPFNPHQEVTGIATILRQEVEQAGGLSLARFMEVALYCQGIGYYERHTGQLGRSGDFYTSVSVGPLFGELLAWQFADWLEALGTGPLQLAEAGAHDGQLAHDILSWLATHRPQLFARVHYWIIEPSLNRQNWQGLKLESFAPRVAWFAGFHALPANGVNGVIFSNELLDSFPAHRIVWDAARRGWFEWGVGREDERFVWRPMVSGEEWTARLTDAGFELPVELLAVLPDGFVLEASPAAGKWWSAAARALCAGRLVTVDYGLTALERLDPSRAGGTLRAYSKHRAQSDALDNPGEQDITAHVNFTQLQRAGEVAGLRTEGLFTQPQFLTRIAAQATDLDGRGGPAAAWTPAQVRQFQTLTHPEHLGRAFRVLVQTR